MSEQLGILDIEFDGKINNKTGDFTLMNEEDMEKFSKSIIYILQDANRIKNNYNKAGNLNIILIKGSKFRYEIAVGESLIKVAKFQIN